MKDITRQIKTFVQDHSQAFKVGAITFSIVAVAVLCVALFSYNQKSNQVTLTYSPVSACALFTTSDAKELLGNDILEANTNKATIAGNRATSKCSYTDQGVDVMKVIAVAVRSAINDQGIQENKDDFAASKKANTVQTVTGIGDEAFFMPANGQLNILDGRGWILISSGTGDDLSAYTLDDAMKVARKVISNSV